MRWPYAVHAACATKSERTDLYPEDRLKIAQDMILAKFNMNKKKTNDMRSRTHDTATALQIVRTKSNGPSSSRHPGCGLRRDTSHQLCVQEHGRRRPHLAQAWGLRLR